MTGLLFIKRLIHSYLSYMRSRQRSALGGFETNNASLSQYSVAAPYIPAKLALEGIASAPEYELCKILISMLIGQNSLPYESAGTSLA